jgi:hypothetical protein
MEKEQLKRIFDFLENQENKIHKDRGKFIWKLKFNETLTKEELNVKGDLNLISTKITSLPKGLKVFGYLDLSYSEIKSLPEGLEVSGTLDLTDTEVTSLPKGLKVGDGLNLAYCDNITSLPKGLKVGGDLDIHDTPLAKYTYDELIEMIKPGFIKGEIIR